MYTDNSFCTQYSSLLWKLIRSRRLDVAGDRIRRQISSPLALSRVSEHKKPSSGRLGAASPSAGALALRYPPAPKFTMKFHRRQCYHPGESLSTGSCHGHHPVLSYRSHQSRPAGDQLQAGSVGEQPGGKGKEAVAKSGRGRRRRMNRLVREGASRASTALSFGGSTSFRGAPLQQPTVRCQCGDVSSSVCWAGGRANRSNWGHVRHWKKRICGRCEIWSGTTAPAATSLVL